MWLLWHSYAVTKFEGLSELWIFLVFWVGSCAIVVCGCWDVLDGCYGVAMQLVSCSKV